MLEQIRQVLQGGARILQYRDKSATAADRQRRCLELAGMCREFDTLLLINDDPVLAANTGAGGVHVGRQDATVVQARDILGPGAVIGVTCHDSLALARTAEAAGADYVAFGSFFPSATKPGAIHAPIALLQQSKAALDIPVVAIGGITLDNAPRLLDAGVDFLAVCHTVFADPSPGARAAEFAALFEQT